MWNPLQEVVFKPSDFAFLNKLYQSGTLLRIIYIKCLAKLFFLVYFNVGFLDAHVQKPWDQSQRL